MNHELLELNVFGLYVSGYLLKPTKKFWETVLGRGCRTCSLYDKLPL